MFPFWAPVVFLVWCFAVIGITATIETAAQAIKRKTRKRKEARRYVSNRSEQSAA